MEALNIDMECFGEQEPLMETLLSMAGKLYELIDMEKQQETTQGSGAGHHTSVFYDERHTEESGKFAKKLGATGAGFLIAIDVDEHGKISGLF